MAYEVDEGGCCPFYFFEVILFIIDALPPVQVRICLLSIIVRAYWYSFLGHRNGHLVMCDLADYATLPFLTAVDVQPHSGTQQPQTPRKTITYITKDNAHVILSRTFFDIQSQRGVYIDKASPPSLSQSPPPSSPSVWMSECGMSYVDLVQPILPLERFSYWCFRRSFLICSDVTRGVNPATHAH